MLLGLIINRREVKGLQRAHAIDRWRISSKLPQVRQYSRGNKMVMSDSTTVDPLIFIGTTNASPSESTPDWLKLRNKN